MVHIVYAQLKNPTIFNSVAQLRLAQEMATLQRKFLFSASSTFTKQRTDIIQGKKSISMYTNCDVNKDLWCEKFLNMVH